MPTSFTDAVRQTKKLGVQDMDKDTKRIAKLIRKRLGRCDDETINTIVDEVIAPRLAIVFGGLDGLTPEMQTVEYAALAIGEDIRQTVLGDERRFL